MDLPLDQPFGTVRRGVPPFDQRRLDALMEEAGIDVLIATSKHNVQYLLGGYRFFFFDYMDATGISRYLPIVVYLRGRPDAAAYIANPNEAYEEELGRFWMEAVHPRAYGTLDATRLCIDHLAGLGVKPLRIGIERGFLPADAYLDLAAAFPEAELVDAVFVMERLRARKTADELAALRYASDAVVDSMLAVFGAMRPGQTKRQLMEALRREEVQRGLTFEYCFVTAGTSHNRAPSGQLLQEGDIVSLDSGGNCRGYLGDLCRMGIIGEPDAELQDLLAGIEAVQQAARRPIRPGAQGAEIYAAAETALAGFGKAPPRFVAHGMGLVSHEAPRLTDSGPVPYPAFDRDRPLEVGMVVSIETTLKHRRGFIKLEDTVAVTADGWESYGDIGRGWNRADPQ